MDQANAPYNFHSIEEVDALRLRDPDAYDRLLRGYKATNAAAPVKQQPRSSGLPEPTAHGDDIAEEPPMEFWIEGMLPQGDIMLIAAQKKVGKSTLLANLARSVLLGEPFLGRNCKKGSVLYISTDETKGSTLSRLDRIGILRHQALASICHRQFDPAWNRKLRSYIAREKYSVIIIDTLFKLAGLTEIKDPGPWAAAYQVLKGLADEYGSTLVVTAHSKKEGQGTNAVAGSFTVTAEPATTLVIEKTLQGERFIFTEQREGTDLERTLLELDRDSMLIRAGEEIWVQRLHETQQEILTSIGSEWASREDILSKVKRRRSLVLDAIGSAISGGWMQRTGRGTRANPYRYSAIERNGIRTPLKAVPVIPVAVQGTEERNPVSVPEPVRTGLDSQESFGVVGTAGKGTQSFPPNKVPKGGSDNVGLFRDETRGKPDNAGRGSTGPGVAGRLRREDSGVFVGPDRSGDGESRAPVSESRSANERRPQSVRADGSEVRGSQVDAEADALIGYASERGLF